MTPEELAHYWSEWTDDNAPLNERGAYLTAARDFLRWYTISARNA